MPEASKNLQEKIRELQKIIYRAVTDLDKCISCGTCVFYCPLKIRVFNNEGKAVTIKTNKSCGGCSVCVKRCKNKAISLIVLRKK
ncbi:MAG: 4Fe-4S dicluster domain-containing protein [Candidatus Lokiarchaeota archaeon]|nr:4Fe-4S dicluster domain-containing protein [Candidatus Lokiarchaeota archaeon]MBD3199609.1 4Fe-4S dicluster domain-containing protein [Candidatus Lokiarchaeota archaeon]